MILTIEGKPIPKKRPRFTKLGHPYNSQKKEMDDVRMLIKGQVNECLEGPVRVNLIFFMPIPKYLAHKITTHSPHIKKPDLDNLEKFILDCLNGIAFKDDSQVYQMNSKKMYSNVPETCIEIAEVEGVKY